MPKKIINVGTDPGNQGDGDTLRVAFEKTSSNFNELYTAQFINDSNLLDHGHDGILGTIASALVLAGINGGGTIIIGPGTYQCNSTLILPKNTRLVGSGRGITLIDVQHNSDGIAFTSGTLGQGTQGGIEQLSIKLPSSSVSSSIFSTSRQSGNDYIQYIELLGGSALSWGITLDSANESTIMGINYKGLGNGIKITNEQNWPVNYGDCMLASIDISLTSSNTTGILLKGNINGIVNNILLNRVEVKTSKDLSNTKGIQIQRASRITLVNIDVENCTTGIENGANSKGCSFINTYAIGCLDDYVEIQPVQQVTILGGHGDFLENQQLPHSQLKLYEPSFAQHVSAVTGIRQIEEYIDTATPRILELADSGVKVFTNKNASGSVLFILPIAANSKSQQFTFTVRTPQELRIIPSANNAILGYDGSTQFTPPGSYIYSSTFGATITVHNIDNGLWVVDSRISDWSVSN